MAEITLDDNKIAVPKRLNLTTFLAEIQKKTKQYLYLINQKEIGIFQDLNEAKKGMWKKLKPSDELCYFYIDSETDTEYVVFSNELAKKIGSFPYEGSAKRNNNISSSVQPSSAFPSSVLPSSVHPTSAFPSSALPSSAIPSSTLPSSSLPYQISQNSIVYPNQNLQAPITSDFSYYPGNQNLPSNNHPNYPPNSVPNNFNTQPSSSVYPTYSSINEIPRYNNIDINETIQHFANLIQSNPLQNQHQQYGQQAQVQNLFQQQRQPQVQHQPYPIQQNPNSNQQPPYNQQPRMSSKSLQNLNRIQAFLKQQTQPQPQNGSQQNQNNIGQGFYQNPPLPRENNLFPQPQNNVNNFTQQSQMNPAQMNPGQINQGQMNQGQFNPIQNANPSQGIFNSSQQGLVQSNMNPSQKVVPTNKKATIPISTRLPTTAMSQQTVQTDANTSARQKYFPPYQGKKKLLQQQNQATQNVAPQPVENKFTA